MTSKHGPVKVVAVYADGEAVDVYWKMSGLVGYRYDEDPLEVIIISSGMLSEEAVAERCKAYMNVEPLDMEASRDKYPEYYL